jgi:2-dehydro-3-deoxyglucarate aldolase
MDLKTKLRKRRITVGSWITIGHTVVAEIMAKNGFDWLAVDMEHSAITLSEAQQLIQVIDLSGVAPLVRVGENSPVLIKRAMDAGAYGVIVPMVNTAEDAERAVKAVKYPPLGARSVGLARAQGYGTEFDRYKKWVNKESIVIAQIEHIDAIENLNMILSTEGIDGSIIGPYDLSGSIGYPGEFDRREVRQAVKRYEDVCGRLRKPMGIHVVHPDPKDALGYMKKGYSFLAVGVDMLYLGNKCRDVLREVIKQHE